MSTQTEPDVTLLDRARRVLPGGTFGNTPAEIVIREGRGARVWDEDGKEYVDFLLGSGPMLIGHGHPDVTAAIAAQAEKGTTFFANNRLGIELAEVIVDAVPCAEQVRFASTGSEADAIAIRLARAWRGRSKILKFEGGYHGYSDYGLMSLAPKQPGNSSRPVPDSAGIPEAIRDDVLVAPFNDADAVADLLREHAGSIAAVIMEPVQRLIPPRPGFLEAIRELTIEHDCLLIFDEVVTGFRMAWGGAQEHFGVVPDLCTMGKAIGGGLPLSAVAGREEIMALFDRERVEADHFVPLVGTLSGNPLAAAAGLATLEVLTRPGTYERSFELGTRLMGALAEAIERSGLDGQVVGVPPMFDVVFAGGEVRDHRDMLRADTAMLGRFTSALRERGVLKGENKHYVSTALDGDDEAQTIEAWNGALSAIAG